MSEKSYSMVLRMNIDCDGCYKKIHRALILMHDLDSHLIEKNQNKVTVCGTFDPQACVIRVRAATNRRVEILQVTELPSVAAPPAAAAIMPSQEEISNKKKKKKKKKIRD